MGGNRPLRKINMLNLEGKIIRRYVDAKDIAGELQVTTSWIYQVINGDVGRTNPFLLAYEAKQPAIYKHRSSMSQGLIFAEIEEFHQRYNGSPVERRCTMCNKVFLSKHSGNRRCVTCNCEVEREYCPRRYKHR